MSISTSFDFRTIPEGMEYPLSDPANNARTATDHSFRNLQRPFIYRNPRYDPGGTSRGCHQYSAGVAPKAIYLQGSKCHSQHHSSFPVPLHQVARPFEDPFAYYDRSPPQREDWICEEMPLRPRQRNAGFEKSVKPRCLPQQRKLGRRTWLSGVTNLGYPGESVTGNVSSHPALQYGSYPGYQPSSDNFTRTRSQMFSSRQRKPRGSHTTQDRSYEVHSASDDTSSSVNTSSWPSIGGDHLYNPIYERMACSRLWRSASPPVHSSLPSREHCIRAETGCAIPGLRESCIDEPLVYRCKDSLPYHQKLTDWQKYNGHSVHSQPRSRKVKAWNSMRGMYSPPCETARSASPAMPRGSPYRGCYDQRSCTRNTDCSKISYDDYQPDLADSFAEELRCGQQTHFECSQSRPDLCYRHPFGQRNHSRHYPKIHKNSLRDERRRLRFERKILEAGQAKLRRDQKWLRWKTQRLQMRQPHAQFYETTLSPGSSSLSPDDSTSNLLRSDTSFPGYRVPGYGDPDDNSTCVSPSSPPVLVAQSKDELDRYNQSWQAVPAESSALPWPTADLTSAKLSARDHTTRDRMVWSEPKVMTWNAFKFLIQGFGIKPHLEMSESGPTWNIANASREQLIALKKQMRLDMLRWSPDKTLHRHPSLRTDERAKAVYEAVQDIYKECQSRLLGVY